jgi:alpha-D-ribose 1-methylphosphonate 5-triphosphate diphosphatase
MFQKRGSFIIKGGSVLMPDGTFVETDLKISNGLIDTISNSSVSKLQSIDASGLMVLPGAVDLHGDAFERQIMPRPGVSFPLDMALFETDRQLVSNGITTAFHGITYSWEPGLRGRDITIELIECFERLRSNFFCSTKFHLRFETYNLEAVEEIESWIDTKRIDFLAFNDHMPSILKKIGIGQSLARFVERTGLTEEQFIALTKRLKDRKGEIEPAIERLSRRALDIGIPMASHDDETSEKRKFFDKIGCKIAEFPLSEAAINEAAILQNNIILGAPNIIRGGSHMGASGLSAIDSIRKGLGNILCSDYYYPSLINAPAELAREGIMGFPSAWNMISKNAAYAANLFDRGEIVEGKRADLILLDAAAPRYSQLVTTFVAGNVVYQSRYI